MKINWSEVFNFLGMLLVGLFFTFMLMLDTIVPDTEISFSHVISNKQSYVGSHKNTFVDGVVLYSDVNKSLYLIGGNPLPNVVTEDDYIIIASNIPNTVSVGDIITVTRPRVEMKNIEQDGVQLDIFYISTFDHLETTGHISVEDHKQFSDVAFEIENKELPRLLISWWLLTSPVSPLIGISPFKPINVYPSYP